MNQKYEKAKFSDVFKYSFGGLGSNLAFFLVMSFLTFFYTDIFGISSYVVATLMLISRFIDAFTDPIMGMLGDNTRSKMGKYRPWIIFGAVGNRRPYLPGKLRVGAVPLVQCPGYLV